MCRQCAQQERRETPFEISGRRLTIPRWANPQARQYLEQRRFPVGNTSMLFGRQVVWTRTALRGRGYHVGAGQPQLSAAEMFEYFPRDRNFYDQHFSFRRSGSGLRGRVRDALTNDDEMWEALYQTYQLWNSDMRLLVYQQHQQPTRARGFLARLDERLFNQIVHAMISLTTTYIAPASGPHAAQTLSQIGPAIQATATLIGRRLSSSMSLADAIVRESQRRAPAPP